MNSGRAGIAAIIARLGVEYPRVLDGTGKNSAIFMGPWTEKCAGRVGPLYQRHGGEEETVDRS